MKNLIRNIIIFHTVLFIVMGLGVWFILKHFFPELLVYGYSIVPVFFYVFGLILIFCFRKASPSKEQKLVNVYMILRIIKIFTTFAMLVIYSLFYKPNVRSFAIVFLVFYLISLVWETYLFAKVENYIKLNMAQNKPPTEQVDSDDLELND